MYDLHYQEERKEEHFKFKVREIDEDEDSDEKDYLSHHGCGLYLVYPKAIVDKFGETLYFNFLTVKSAIRECLSARFKDKCIIINEAYDTYMRISKMSKDLFNKVLIMLEDHLNREEWCKYRIPSLQYLCVEVSKQSTRKVAWVKGLLRSSGVPTDRAEGIVSTLLEYGILYVNEIYMCQVILTLPQKEQRGKHSAGTR